MKKLLLILLCLPIISFSQTRYLDDIFTSVTVTSDVQFAANISILPAVLSGGVNPPALTPIMCDIYEPTGDNLTERPVVILAHTGSFLPQVINGQPTGDKKDSSIVQQCMRWARKGYVAVAMNNRLGWNPTSTDQDRRTSTWLQAIYRGIQDAKAMVRFLRKTEDIDGNPYGIDPTKIALGGQGTGGYLSLGYATLDTVGDVVPFAEIYLPKFINLTTMMPYVYPPYFGNYDGTDSTWLPIYDTLGNLVGQMPWNIPNWPSYSNDINMAFNIGGCLADSSWLEQGDVPMVSFHCTNDPYGPYVNGDVIVPTTGHFVVEVQGSYIVQKHQAMYGNNAVFANAGFSDVFTTAANVNNDGYEGLYPFLTPTPVTTTPNVFMEYNEEQGAPWDWWDNVWYDNIHQAIHSSPPGYGPANSILGNPNMSSVHGNAYLDTIQGYLNPRMFLALGLDTISVSSVLGCTDSLACNYDSLATIDDSSCVYLTANVTAVSDYNGYNVSCYGACDAWIEVTISGGITPYTYLWDDTLSQTTATSIGLCAGVYTVVATDNNGCQISDTITISEPGPLVANITPTPTSCFGGNDGSVSIQVTGGASPYTGYWTGPNGFTATIPSFISAPPILPNLSPGIYTLAITDANGCQITSPNISVTQPTALTISLSTTLISCFGGSNGTATASVSGGAGGYTYLWNPGGQTTNPATSLTAGTYSLLVIDANGCINQSPSTISLPNPLLLLSQQSFTICAGDSIVVGPNIYYNVGNYTDSLLSVNGCDSIIYTNITVNQHTSSYDTLSVNVSIVWNGMTLTLSGDYSFTLTNSVGCDSIVNLNLTINPSGILNIKNTEKTLLRITDILGRETPYKKNTPLFYKYDDGTVEKRITIE